ncbi:hypothetical protein [Halobacillus naozhouensis]|uniref:Uncharacterized protein n=1 Tax=Halobacillus naozhouensis TaxID=554880 RepID=A0ABY8IU63_9BACI|nr:hypothetical protein [Halobacillus naozhouensis]WFT73620.1 hypothetical protein P9989_14735 [Halobacillus naozhouensis]
MDGAIITFIFTLTVVLIINFTGHRLIVNKGEVLGGKTITILLVQSLTITIILSFV